MDSIEAKKLIIDLFNLHVKGKKSDSLEIISKHDGYEGHWLEKQMGIKVNKDNLPDLMGYEMKNQTSSKTTFGDWYPDYIIYKDLSFNIDRIRFFKIFGRPNPLKNNRYSWSGDPFPKVGKYNEYGQTMVVDSDNNVLAMYSYSQDKRVNKSSIVPIDMQIENLVVARWNADNLKLKLERKFGGHGWFKCVKNSDGIYSEIVFGEPITFDNWIERVRTGIVYVDGAMYETNHRNYSNWRANNKFWDSLIVERY